MTDTEQKQFNHYGDFVVSTTSEESLSTVALVDRLLQLDLHLSLIHI